MEFNTEDIKFTETVNAEGDVSYKMEPSAIPSPGKFCPDAPYLKVNLVPFIKESDAGFWSEFDYSDDEELLLTIDEIFSPKKSSKTAHTGDASGKTEQSKQVTNDSTPKAKPSKNVVTDVQKETVPNPTIVKEPANVAVTPKPKTTKRKAEDTLVQENPKLRRSQRLSGRIAPGMFMEE